jgi:mercuric ion transport protein
MRQETNALRIEMVFDRTCPNVERARSMIRTALAQVGAPEAWTEWDRDDPATPDDLRGFGSPTVLVNGHDVVGDENEAGVTDANSCRVYVDDCGCICGAPSSSLIVSAIRNGR